MRKYIYFVRSQARYFIESIKKCLQSTVPLLQISLRSSQTKCADTTNSEWYQSPGKVKLLLSSNYDKIIYMYNKCGWTIDKYSRSSRMFYMSQIRNSNICWESQLKQMCEYDIKLKLCADVCVCVWGRRGVIVFNATFNNISAIDCWSVLLVENRSTFL